MSFVTAIGLSDKNDSKEAAADALKQIKDQIGEIELDLVLIFFTDTYDHQAVYEVCKDKLSRFVGACVPGVISGSEVYEKCVSAFGLRGDNLDVRTSFLKGRQEDAYRSGEIIGEYYSEYLRDDMDNGSKDNGPEKDDNGFVIEDEAGTLFIFPDGFSYDISSMLRGIYNKLGSRVRYAGGGSGDNLKFHKPCQFTENGISDKAVATAFVKGFLPEQTVGHGWSPRSEAFVITKAKGKVVYEIDGIPAFERYSELLGGITKKNFSYYGMKHPVGIPCIGDRFLIRDPIEVGEDDSLVFVSELPQDTAGVIMEAGVDELVENAFATANNACAKENKFVLVFDCVSRYLLMKKDFEKELSCIGKHFDKKTFGILTFGEISSSFGLPLFFNKSIVFLTG
ncbi:FIST signal transduction protein [Natranaerofaba carboxydovora]|uniref:FIST signal transduction protein n=1 Tax=Natranaerofaba carboxydovora TaxID=2742683 RepID=UPI001F12F145|nr:FIST N-terminal domain-containing protein [Natranaerofaba carboxydovora]UMZ74654.1 FIST N domain protein [Natranaerofaba carboxydovora]